MSENPLDAYLESIAGKAEMAKQGQTPEWKSKAPETTTEKPSQEGWSEVDKVVKGVFERAVLEQKRADRRQSEQQAASEQYDDLLEWYQQKGESNEVIDAAKQESSKSSKKADVAKESADRFHAFIQKGKEVGVITEDEISEWETRADEKIKEEEEARQRDAEKIITEQKVIAEATKEMERSIEELRLLKETMLKNQKWEPQQVLQQIDDIKQRLNLIGKELGMDWETLLQKIPNGVDVLFAIQVIELNADLGKE